MRTVYVKTGEIVHVELYDEGRDPGVQLLFENTVGEPQYVVVMDPEEAILLASYILTQSIECVSVRG